MSIPFTQYLLPDGRKKAESIARPAAIEALARRFIDAGGYFECEMLTDMETVSLTAGIDDEDIAIRLARNGPDIPVSIDALVREAAAFLDASAVRPAEDTG